MKRPRRLRRRLAPLCVLLALSAATAAADVVAEVVAMLEGEISEQVILDWLEAGGESFERPSAAQLIELKRAGASEELLRGLIARSRPPTRPTPPDAPPGAPAALPAGDAPAATPAAVTATSPAPALPPERGAAAGAGSMPAAGDARVRVRFRLLYAPRFDEDDEPWDLLVYLDGWPLSYVPASGGLLGPSSEEPLEVEIELSPGSHTLRVLQERHRRQGRGWRHAARVAESAFGFELSGGEDVRVEVDFDQSWADLNDPLTFRFTQGDRAADRVEVGGDPELWPELCEDAGRKAPAGCVGWASLWPVAAPPRAEVLEALAGFEFRPVPR